MNTYIWNRNEVPQELRIKQVYGIVFDDNGHILLRVDDNKYKLTGGKPEIYDNDFLETLKREYLEELNVEIQEIYYLGYLLVKEKEEQYAQVRMIAKIKKIDKIEPDTDNGKIYKRFMSKQENTKKYLNYQDFAGNQLIDDAIKLANQKFHFSFDDTSEYFI